MSDYPYVAVERCPDCDRDVVAVIEQVPGQPRDRGGVMHVSWDLAVRWMRGCPHTGPTRD